MPVWERRLREWPRDRIKPQGVAKCIDLMLADLAAAREREQRLAEALFSMADALASSLRVTHHYGHEGDPRTCTELTCSIGRQLVDAAYAEVVVLAAAAPSAVAQEPRGEGE